MGVAKMTKEGVTLIINDRKLIVKPLTWKEVGKFENFIRSQRIAILHTALELTKPPHTKDMLNIAAYPPDTEIPPDVIKYHEWLDSKTQATNEILKSVITGEDMGAAEATIEGLMMVVRLELRDNPDLDTIMDELFDMENREGSQANISLIRQTAESGGAEENPPQPEPETPPPAEQPTAPPESE